MVKRKQFTTVTTFSKILAGILFILLPVLGFYLGMQYGLALSKGNELDNQFIPAGTINIVQPNGWKTYTDIPLGYRFQYPPNWSKISTTTGDAFLSPDHTLIFTVQGPYTQSVNQLISLQKGEQVISKTTGNILGHPATEEELLIPNGNTWNDVLNIFIGNIKMSSMLQKGSLNLTNETLIPTLRITDASHHAQAVQIFNQILATIQFNSH